MHFQDEFAVQHVEVITQVFVPAFLRNISSVNVTMLFFLDDVHCGKEQSKNLATERTSHDTRCGCGKWDGEPQGHKN